MSAPGKLGFLRLCALLQAHHPDPPMPGASQGLSECCLHTSVESSQGVIGYDKPSQAFSINLRYDQCITGGLESTPQEEQVAITLSLQKSNIIFIIF